MCQYNSSSSDNSQGGFVVRILPDEQVDLCAEIKRSYVAFGQLPDGRYCGLYRLLYHWTIHIGITEYGYDDRYCFQTASLGLQALTKWDGEGDPDFWHKHPKSGRRRDIVTGHIWQESEVV
jgi:hypothetical protein